MATKTGDRIVVESETVGTPAREGEIVEILHGNVGISYRVRWTDGHETLFTPGGGNTRIEPKTRARSGSGSRPASKDAKKRSSGASASSGRRRSST